MLSITALIKDFLKENSLTQVYLAEQLKESPQNLANKLRKHDLNADYIRRISIALDHDFFADLSQQLKPELKSGSQSKIKAASMVLTNGESGYVRQEQYIRLLEEHLQLYREMFKAGRENP